MPSPEIIVLSTLAFVAVIAVAIISLNQRKRGLRQTVETEPLIRLDAKVAEAVEDEPALEETEEALYSIEPLELASADAFQQGPFIFAPDSEPSLSVESAAPTWETETLAEQCPEEEETEWNEAALSADLPEAEITATEEFSDETAEATDHEVEVALGEEAPAEVVALLETPEDTTPLPSSEEEIPLLLEEHAPEETSTMESGLEPDTADDEALRRATVRRAPRRHRRPRTVDENLDSQISDLDHRLDALEALVASIEQGLAEFEPLLGEIDGGPDFLNEDLPEENGGHAQAA